MLEKFFEKPTETFYKIQLNTSKNKPYLGKEIQFINMVASGFLLIPLYKNKIVAQFDLYASRESFGKLELYFIVL